MLAPFWLRFRYHFLCIFRERSWIDFGAFWVGFGSLLGPFWLHFCCFLGDPVKSENRAGAQAPASFSAFEGVPKSLFLRPPSHKPLGAPRSLSFFKNLAIWTPFWGALGTPCSLAFCTFFQERFLIHVSVPRGSQKYCPAAEAAYLWRYHKSTLFDIKCENIYGKTLF